MADLEYADAESGTGFDRDLDGGQSLVPAIDGDAGAARRRADSEQPIGPLERYRRQGHRHAGRHLEDSPPAVVTGQLDEDVALAGQDGNRAGCLSYLGAVHADRGAGRVGRNGDIGPVGEQFGFDGLGQFPALDLYAEVRGLVVFPSHHDCPGTGGHVFRERRCSDVLAVDEHAGTGRLR